MVRRVWGRRLRAAARLGPARREIRRRMRDYFEQEHRAGRLIRLSPHTPERKAPRMYYPLAMGLLKGQRTAVRASVPENRIVKRFGTEQRLNPSLTARPAYISWTPTLEDIKADDWHVYEDDGTAVDPPRPVVGDPAAGDPPTPASGGTAAGTGWRKA